MYVKNEKKGSIKDMYKNIGSKIKTLAIFIFVLGIIASFALFIIYCSYDLIGYAFLCLIFGPICSWIGTFVLYGFGQLIENSDKQTRMMEKERFLQNLAEQSKNVSSKEKTSQDIDNNENIVNIYKKIFKYLDNKVDALSCSEYVDVLINLYINKLDETEILILKNRNKDFAFDIHRLSTNELNKRIDKYFDWQEDYIVLCLIELKERGE